MKFEGAEVDGGQVVLRQYTGSWPLDEPLVADSVVTLEVDVYVQFVNHGVNQRTGDLMRSHTLKVQDVRTKGKK